MLIEKQPVEMFSYQRILFPPQNFMLNSPKWQNQPYAFYGGQQVDKVYKQASDSVNTAWQWDPVLEYKNTQNNDNKTKSVDQGKGATAALQPWETSVGN